MSANQFKSPVVRWIDHRLPVFSMLHHTAHDYPTPKNLNYMWNFGSLAGLSLAIMIVTGIVLAMSYTAHVDYAFDSGRADYAGCEPWMDDPLHSHEHGEFLLHCHLSSHVQGALLWLLQSAA
jgi:quinol-cytochrome oxidoreductase complex cytochrome b subunit